MSRYHRHKLINKHRTLIIKKSRHARLIDRATYVVAILEPLITVPQVVTIFAQHTAAGVSLSTWFGYEILTVIWLCYGYIHRDKIIILYQGLFMIMQTGVIVGGLIYGAKW